MVLFVSVPIQDQISYNNYYLVHIWTDQLESSFRTYPPWHVFKSPFTCAISSSQVLLFVHFFETKLDQKLEFTRENIHRPNKYQCSLKKQYQCDSFRSSQFTFALPSANIVLRACTVSVESNNMPRCNHTLTVCTNTLQFLQCYCLFTDYISSHTCQLYLSFESC